MIIVVTLEPIPMPKATDRRISAARLVASKSMAELIVEAYSQFTFLDDLDIYIDGGDDRPTRLIATTDDIIALSHHYPWCKKTGFKARRGMTLDNITFPLVDYLTKNDVVPYWPSIINLQSVISERWPLPPSSEEILFELIGEGARKKTLDKLKGALDPSHLYQVEPQAPLSSCYLVEGGEAGVKFFDDHRKVRNALIK